MELYLLSFVTLVMLSTQTQIHIVTEMVNFRDNSTSAWVLQTRNGHSLKLQRRIPQGTKMSESERKKAVHLHNLYRSMVIPSAANMEYMEWDNSLAALAQRWAQKCQWKHGNLPHKFPRGIGQNLYRGPVPSISTVTSFWFEEYKDYNYFNITCKLNKKCGHYTQMAWATTRYVGCGISDNCWVDHKYYIVCNYWPPGNYPNTKPYIKGTPCTRCNFTGNALCSKNSCVNRDQCEKYKMDCACNIKCYNCGELDMENCECKCKDGWKSQDCTEPCVDMKKCDKQECWRYKMSRVHPCEATCGRCKGVNQSDLRNTCCDGVLCPYGQVYYSWDRPCVCRILCPGPKCGAFLHGPYFVLFVIMILFSGYFTL